MTASAGVVLAAVVAVVAGLATRHAVTGLAAWGQRWAAYGRRAWATGRML